MSTIGYINVSIEFWGSILSLILAICMVLGGEMQNKLNRLFVYLLLCNMAVLLNDAAAWLFKGHMDIISYYGVRISNMCAFSAEYVLLAIFTNYISSYIRTKTPISKTPARIVWILCFAAVAMVILNQFNHMYYMIDEDNMYQRQSYFWLSMVWPIAGMLINAGILIRYRNHIDRKEGITFGCYIFLPVLAMTIQIFVYGIALVNLLVTVGILILYINIQLEQVKHAKEKELELADSRMAVLVSQIQPHFLYNCLTVIRHLCDTDPKQAGDAVTEFALYMRGNLDALTSKQMIPFWMELEHTKNYLSLEKRRFGDKVKVQFHIEADQFLIPPLTVQTLVENAVRHGIAEKPGSGTVTIRTKEAVDDFCVEIVDDGAGMTLDDRPDGHRHVGLDNTKKRLELMCGGRVSIESEKGQGTAITILIPKGGTTPCS